MYAATIAEITMTMIVSRMTVWRSGQVTFCSSDQHSWAKRTSPTLPVLTAGACERAAITALLHGGRDSNSQPLVLETSALPVELPPYAAGVERHTAAERRSAKTAAGRSRGAKPRGTDRAAVR